MVESKGRGVDVIFIDCWIFVRVGVFIDVSFYLIFIMIFKGIVIILLGEVIVII